MPSPLFLASFYFASSTTGDINIRALIVACRYIGDVLLATPLAQSLNKAGYQVDWIVAPGTEAILDHQPYANEVFTVGAQTSWIQQCSLGLRLFRRYNSAFAMPSSDRSMLLALAASGSVSALIVADRTQDAWKRRIVKHWNDYTPGNHMVSLACALANANRLPACRDVLIHWDDEDRQQVFSSLSWHEEKPFIHIHPFARWPYKWWNKEDWKTLIQTALKHDLCVTITGSPAEYEAAKELAYGLPDDKVTVLAGHLNWRQLACLSKHAAAYIGLDTANTHLAAAANAKVIALFGPTDPRIWGPWPNGFMGVSPWKASSSSGIQRQGNISLLQGKQDCVPCQLEGCDRHQNSESLCLKNMQETWVWQEIYERVFNPNELNPMNGMP